MSTHRNEIAASIVYFDSCLEELRRCILTVLEAFVHSYEKYGSKFSYRLILINNGGMDLAELVTAFENRYTFDANSVSIDLLQGHGNLGYGCGHNMSLEAFPSCYHLFLNPDVTLEVDVIAAGIQFLNSNPDIAIASPSCVHSTGQKLFLCKQYPTVLVLFLRAFSNDFLQQIFAKRLQKYEMRGFATGGVLPNLSMLSGCFMLCRTSILIKANGFDPRYFLYFEDFDLSIRASEYGNLAYVPTMKICHNGGYASKKGLKHILLFVRSAFRFFNAHGWKWY